MKTATPGAANWSPFWMVIQHGNCITLERLNAFSILGTIAYYFEVGSVLSGPGDVLVNQCCNLHFAAHLISPEPYIYRLLLALLKTLTRICLIFAHRPHFHFSRVELRSPSSPGGSVHHFGCERKNIFRANVPTRPPFVAAERKRLLVGHRPSFGKLWATFPK